MAVATSRNPGRGRRGPAPVLRKAFETVGMAKVSTSASVARELGFLRSTDRITCSATS